MRNSSRRALLRGAAALLAAGALPGAAQPQTQPVPRPRAGPVLATRYGRVRGRRIAGIDVWLGVRYGADTAMRRFQAAVAPEPWRGVRAAVEYGPACPQRGAAGATSEDCLFLNVWAPARAAATRRPIMVYLHGGAYSTGSGSDPLYDGAALSEYGDVIVITLNHRLNAFGYAFLARLGDARRFPDSGNAGMLDLVLALDWIRAHAAMLGGDPQRVMVFGQSGGGAKIATLMAMPAAAGLFQRAATMSGQQVTASGPLNATRRASALLQALGLPVSRVDDLAAVPAAQLVAASSTRDPVIGEGPLYFGPVLDQRSLPRHPFFPDAPPQSAAVPMIIGNTREETRSLIGANDAAAFSIRWDELPERLARELRVDIAPEHVVASYRRLYPHASASDVLFAATTAARSWRGALIELEARAAAGHPTWAYQLDFASPQDGGRWGAHHTLDIPLVFGTLAAPGSRTGAGEAAQRTSRAMMDAFIAFAQTGEPNPPSLPPWARYDLARRTTMLFDMVPTAVEDPRGAERRLFEGIPFIQQGT